MIRLCAILLALSAGAAAAEAPRAFKLPKILAEVSGLEVAGPHSVFAHNDEVAIIHEIDIRDGEVMRSFAFGRPNAFGDFEGIARAGAFLYLATSDGRIYEGAPVGHGERTVYNVYDTGLGDRCEIEGLAAGPEARSLYVLCKRTRDDPGATRIVIYRWRFDERLEALAPFLDIAVADVAPAPEKGSFKAADLKVDPETGDFIIVDANAGAVVRMTRKGKPVSYVKLAGEHPQAEGLAILPGGAMIIGDEGGKKSGRLTVYPANRGNP